MRLVASIVLATILFLAAAEAVVYTLNALCPPEPKHCVTWIKL
jgi:hypothetical protein